MNEAIEAAAIAIEQIILRRLHANRVEGYTLDMSKEQARAAAPALMEEGARLALEAAARIVNGWRECDWPEGYHPHAINEICEDRAMRVRALDPAAIVKGAGHE